MEKTEMMKRYEAETGESLEEAKERWKTFAFYSRYITWLEAKANISDEAIEAFQKIIRNQCDEISALKEKAEAYDRLMSGQAAMTLKEIANFKGRPITVDADGAINAHGAEPHLSRGGFAGYTDCWANGADDYEEIPESFVEIPDGFDWTTSLTLPDGWEVTE